MQMQVIRALAGLGFNEIRRVVQSIWSPARNGGQARRPGF